MKKHFPDLVLVAVLVGTLAAAAILTPPVRKPGAAPAPTPATTGERAEPSGHFAIRDVRVFDGEQMIERASVVVRDGLIAHVGPDVPIADGIAVVDGRGRTLLPGLIDAHVHAWGEAQRDALRFGVGTEIDMHGDASRLPALKAQRASLREGAAADLWAAGTAVTAPGGHGTQYGFTIPTLAPGDDVRAFVDARVDEGADFIKLIVEDLGVYSGAPKWPTLAATQVATAIEAAHARGRIAVVHVSRQVDALVAIRSGADGLAHVFVDETVGAELVAEMKARDAFVVPTLSVTAQGSGDGDGSSLVADARLKPFLSSAQANSLGARIEVIARDAGFRDRAFASVRALNAAGVTILAGTDAGNPGTAHGASLHGELELLVRAGLSPAEALAAATALPARRFGMTDRGRIAPGLRADLVLVDGNPLDDITATRAIAMAWKSGHAVTRAAIAATDVDAPVAHAATRISDFDGDSIDMASGGFWLDTSDTMMGGASVASHRLVSGGAAGSPGALEITGEIRPGFIEPWAGAMFFVDATPMQPHDYSARKELVFHIQGDGREVRVMLLSGPTQEAMPAVRSVPTGPEWTEVRLPLASFVGADMALLRGIAFSAGNPPGAFRFRIDGVELR
ncbi:MAG TPA: CIA30 family protein [Dokdonella sp.]|uniref:CIA30 family protein n=1 Tax=Dokdonella sp. TaxID=2291710 RepID=UPI0025C0C91F|nr:CIA30 family protein [Dokdonella sp.]MBX3692238.1 CIA30 family protein [Dokdonella sp.]HNR90917.1 CIA30 family protein [Dokdonella sp.]